jgi:hypothetical protein
MHEMKQPELGQTVLWFPEGDRSARPHPAVVTEIGQSAITCNVMGSDYRNFDVRGGVHHVDDPLSKKDAVREAGAWDFTPRDKMIDKLLADLGG